MATRDEVMRELAQVPIPGGRTLAEADMVRALTISDDEVRFVIEAPDAEFARALDPARAEAERQVARIAALRLEAALGRISGVMIHYNCENGDFDLFDRQLTRIEDEDRKSVV